MLRYLSIVFIIQSGMMVFGSKESDLFDLFYRLAKRSACSSLKPSFATSYSDVDDFNQQMKEWHDYLRCFHGAGTVSIDKDLLQSAQAWADSLASGGPIKHSDDRCGVGENIFVAWGYDDLPAWKVVRGDATKDNYGYGWYCSEFDSFDFNAKKYQMGSGHFTQVVWKDTLEIGCGISKSGSKTIAVCQYWPGGNIGTPACWNDYAVPGFQNGATPDMVCPSTNS